MDKEDITDAILNGLDSTSYKIVIDVIHARDIPISFHELHEKLINHELSLVQLSTVCTNIHQLVTTFATNKCPPTKPWNNQNSNNAPAFLPTPQQPTNHTHKILGKCQFYFIKGHSLTSCYAFKNKYPHVNLPPLPRTSHNNGHPQAHAMNTTNISNAD